MEKNETEESKAPYVRIVGNGCDVMIQVTDSDDRDIAHQAIDMVLSRYSQSMSREDFDRALKS